jgi:hypothetical protein
MVQSFEGSDLNRAAQWFPTKRIPARDYEFDIVTGNRNVAKYRHPDGVAGTQALRTKERKTVMLPTIREKKMIKESTIRWLDGAGQKRPPALDAEIAAELRDLDDIVSRASEKARWELLTTGIATVNIDGVDTTYDFGIGSEASAVVGWTTTATSTPIDDLILWKQTVKEKGGVEPKKMLIGTTAVNLIFKSVNGLNMMAEMTRDEYRKTGKIGQLIDMDVIVVDDQYENDAGAQKYFMSTDGAATDMVLLLPGDAVGLTVEGAVVDSKAPAGHMGKFAKSWEQDDPSGRFVLEALTCLPGLTRPNTIGAFTLY